MKNRTYEGVSLLHGSERSARLFFLPLLFSISLHGVFVVVFVFLSTYTPNQNRFTQSVINVSMVSFPSEEEPVSGDFQPPTPAEEPAETTPEPPLVTAEESEVQVPVEEIEPPKPEPVEKAVPEPAPQPTPRDQVVIEDAPEQRVPPEPETVRREPAPSEAPPEEPIRTKRRQTRKPEKASAKVVKPEEVRTDSIKDAISRVREKVANEIARKGAQQSAEPRAEPPGRSGSTGGVPVAVGASGPISDVYRAQLTYQIEKNWAFPEHLADARGDLATVIVVNISPNGHINDVWFKDRSGNSYLDDSAYRAVMKSNPLPPLPKGYNAYTVALVFTPSGLN